ncbi:dual specificity protein phosphatase cdc14b-like [Limosa lapponica baueri]|uniref:Dual specificity protein phosphatase cdc14b-like n=1 Tax=Limosa lapponica baueri TaxID=1758121 RepID=A0A2I0UIW9_LIMLA|nr:dual specificity protein phosphatase cdc14b-like [Limosa lapponica baueri]
MPKSANFTNMNIGLDRELAFHLPSCPQDLDLMVTIAMAAFDLHNPNKPLIVDAYEVQQNTSPGWLFCHLEDEVINALQEPPGLLVPCCVAPPM